MAETEPAAEETDRLSTIAAEAAELVHKLNRLNGRITGLYRAVMDSPFAPTTTQIRQLTELESELEAAGGRREKVRTSILVLQVFLQSRISLYNQPGRRLRIIIEEWM